MFPTDNLKKTVFLSLMIVFSIVLNFLENLIPLGSMIPGVKIGISNIVILAIIYIYSPKEGIMCAFLKSVLITFLGGNLSSFVYSVSGGLISAIGMGAFKKVKGLSPVGVSMTGSFLHISTQIGVAYLTLNSYTVFYYYPYLLLFGIISGFVNGYLVKLLLEKLERRV